MDFARNFWMTMNLLNAISISARSILTDDKVFVETIGEEIQELKRPQNKARIGSYTRK